MIITKERVNKVLLQEFDEQVLIKDLPGEGREFVDDVLIPYSEAYERLQTRNCPEDMHWSPVNKHENLLAVLHTEWKLN